MKKFSISVTVKPCSDERQNGFELFNTQTKQFSALKIKYVHIYYKNVLNVLDSSKKCI